MFAIIIMGLTARPKAPQGKKSVAPRGGFGKSFLKLAHKS
jgi:hypothetical protein